MQFKLIVALVDDDKADRVLAAAREAGATGFTVVSNARGEGLIPQKTFFGLNLAGQRDMLLVVVEEHMSRQVLEAIASAGQFEEKPGSGIALQLAVEDAVGLSSQIQELSKKVEDQL